MNLLSAFDNDPVLNIDVLGAYWWDFQGKGWTQTKKDEVYRAQRRAADRSEAVLKDLDGLVEKAQRLCDKCVYRSPLIRALAELRTSIKNIKAKLNGDLKMPLYLTKKSDPAGEFIRSFNIYGGITSERMEIYSGASEHELAGTLFHEASHHAAGTDDDSETPWTNAHNLDNLIDGTLADFAVEMRNYLLAKYRRWNCPKLGDLNVRTEQQWPNNP